MTGPSYRALVVTASNRAAAGVYEDKGGPLIAAGLTSYGFEVDGPRVVPDGDPVEAALRAGVDAGYDVIVTTGGTGISPTDRTPEATRRVLDHEVPGIPEAIRAFGREGSDGGVVPGARRSRGTDTDRQPARFLRRGEGRTGRSGASADSRRRPDPRRRPPQTQRHRGCELNSPSWPVELVDGDVVLRPIKVRDQRVWREVNRRNRDWLRPWEATIPPPTPSGPIAHRPTYRQMVRHLRAEANAGRMLPFVIEYQGRLVGQLTVAGITWGSMCSGHIGYWVDQSVAGRGVMPTAVALVTDHCFRTVGLHRIEVCIRPENGPSRRVVEKLGFREEGLRPRYLHIDGAWRDHLVFALTAEEVPEGLLGRWQRARAERARSEQARLDQTRPGQMGHEQVRPGQAGAQNPSKPGNASK